MILVVISSGIVMDEICNGSLDEGSVPNSEVSVMVGVNSEFDDGYVGSCSICSETWSSIMDHHY